MNAKKFFISKSLVACEDAERDDGVENAENAKVPGFSLLPVSKGFSITLKKALDDFAKLCDQSIASSSSSMIQSDAGLD